jgi:general secretion pathway protein D
MFAGACAPLPSKSNAAEPTATDAAAPPAAPASGAMPTPAAPPAPAPAAAPPPVAPPPVAPAPAPALAVPAPAAAAVPPPVAPPPSDRTDGALLGHGKDTEAAPHAQPVVERGTGQFINQDAAARGAPPRQPDGDVTFNFEAQPIAVVVKAILGDLLHESYVIAPGVSGEVTFSTARPIRSDQALAVLEMLLSWSGAALVQRDGRYTVLPVAQAVQGNLAPRMGPLDPSRGYAVRVVPLHYVAATEMEKLLQPYARQGAVIKADNARSMIVLAGNSADLQNYLDTIEIFDVNWLSGMSVGIYPLERVEVKEVVPELEKIFGESANTPLAGMFRFMPIDRLNAVLVITPQPKYLEEAEKWLGKLDRGGSESGTQLYVYYVKNVKAVDLADNLNEIFGGSASAPKQKKSASPSSLAPNLRPVEISNQAKPKEPPKAAAPNPEGISVGGGDSDIRITAIEDSNALMIRATPGEYDDIQKAIKRLDVQPLQVHIEAKILSVDLTDNLSLGVEWAFDHGSLQGTSAGQVPGITDYRLAHPGDTHLHSFAGRSGSGGLSWAFVDASAEALLSSLQTNRNARVLSAPSLVVLNNKEASINVGIQLPVNSTSIIGTGTGTGTGTGSGVGSGLTQSYTQFRNTGITLEVTPRVNPGGLVYMEIKQEDSQPLGADTAVNGNVSVSQRQISTEIAVQSGKTVLLGGLIKEDESVDRNGVPGLSRIPILGSLFGKHSRSGGRSELLVLITPTVIGTPEEAESLTDEYRKRMRGIEPLIRRSEARQGDARPKN